MIFPSALAAAALASPSPVAAGQKEAAAIIWSGTLFRQPADNEEIVLSIPAGESPRLQLRRRATAPAGLTPLPLATNLLPQSSAAPFGSDERCSVAATGGSFTLRCRPGTSIGGAVLSLGPFRLPQNASLRVRLTTSEGAGFSAELTSKGAEASAPRPIRAGETLLPLPPLDENTEPQLVVIAPPEGGEFILSRMEIAPATPAARPRESAAWIWDSGKWRDAPSTLIGSARLRGVGRLFITLDISDGALRHERELRRFVAMARAAGIAVEAVEGDPRMVLSDGLKAATARARAYAAYQQKAAAAERLAGIQYDVEPYVLPGWGDHPVSYSGWAEAILRLSAAAGEKVDLVLPFWVSGEEDGREFLRRVEPATRSLTIMSYRTEAPVLTQIAEPLLAWGAARGIKVRLALEAGQLPDETEEVFRPAASGTLAVAGGPHPRVYLLGKEGIMEGARMFERSHKILIPAQRLSFLGNEEAMAQLAGATAPVFSAWPSFSGFALHGLDWDRPTPR